MIGINQKLTSKLERSLCGSYKQAALYIIFYKFVHGFMKYFAHCFVKYNGMVKSEHKNIKKHDNILSRDV